MEKRNIEEKEPFEIVKMSELPDKRQEKTRVIIMDKPINRKIKPGEELRLEEIAGEESISDFPEIPDRIPEADMRMMWGDKPRLSSNELWEAISRDFGTACSGGRVFVSKSSYFLYKDEEIKKVLSEDLTDLQMWINTYFHSPDFSLVLEGVMKDKLKGIPFGILWVKGPSFYHACNCFYSQNEKMMKVVEPQTDAIYDFNKASWCPMLVVI
ncbi:MAG: hypothetical protein JSV09_14780 [Thermoplasmata archaeon]|nr:MAG: hypothetical protein JSV09_14780 [Thermoplasmata archaeon]